MATQHTLKFKKLRSSTLNRKRRTKSKILLREQSTYLKEHSKHYSYSLLSRSPKKNLREVSNVNFINNQKIQKPSIAVIESKPTDYNAIENRKPYALDFALVECIPNDFDIFIQEEDETSTVNIFPTKPSNHKLQKKSNKKLTQNNKSKSCLHISEVNEVTPSDVIGIVDEDLSTTTINFPPSREKHHCVDNTIKKSCISHSGVSRLRRIESEIDESLKSQIYTDVVSAINSVITELLPNKYAKKVNIIFKNINNDSESKCNGNEFSGSGIAYDNNMHSSSSDSKDDTLKVTIELEALRNGSINKVSLDQNVRSNNSSRSLAVHGDVSRNVKTEDCISINCNSAYNSIAKTYIAAIQLINEDIKTGTETSIFEVSDFAQSTKKLMKHISDSIVNNDTKHEEISEESIPLIYDAEVGDVLEISSDNLNQTSNSNDTRLFTNSYPYFTIEDEELSPNSIAKNADDRKHGRFMAVIGSGIDSGEDSSIIEEQISYSRN